MVNDKPFKAFAGEHASELVEAEIDALRETGINPELSVNVEVVALPLYSKSVA
jgi:hypothetical protein